MVHIHLLLKNKTNSDQEKDISPTKKQKLEEKEKSDIEMKDVNQEKKKKKEEKKNFN